MIFFFCTEDKNDQKVCGFTELLFRVYFVRENKLVLEANVRVVIDVNKLIHLNIKNIFYPDKEIYTQLKRLLDTTSPLS